MERTSHLNLKIQLLQRTESGSRDHIRNSSEQADYIVCKEVETGGSE